MVLDVEVFFCSFDLVLEVALESLAKTLFFDVVFVDLEDFVFGAESVLSDFFVALVTRLIIL